jgi:hypothetical protein
MKAQNSSLLTVVGGHFTIRIEDNPRSASVTFQTGLLSKQDLRPPGSQGSPPDFADAPTILWLSSIITTYIPYFDFTFCRASFLQLYNILTMRRVTAGSSGESNGSSLATVCRLPLSGATKTVDLHPVFSYQTQQRSTHVSRLLHGLDSSFGRSRDTNSPSLRYTHPRSP